MNKKQFQQVKQYVGPVFLNYVLNHDEITVKSDFDLLEMLPVQIQVLDDLYANIQQSRNQFIKQGGFGDMVGLNLKRITPQGQSLFNYYRQLCGGLILKPNSNDPLLSYLQKICIREYPNILIESSRASSKMPLLGLTLGMNTFNEFIRLVKDDILDQITNRKDGLEYAFQFSTTDGLEFHSQVGTACSSIIVRSFYDSCNRMDYSLSSVLKAIERNIDLLRKLASGQEATYSSFIGIKGLQFNGFDVIEFPCGVLRQFRDNVNPGMHTRRTVVSHSGNEVEGYSGHVFEIFHSTKISSTSGKTNTSNSVEINRVQENELQKLRFAVVFSSLATRGPVPSFFEVGFPIIQPGNYGFVDDNPETYILIDKTTKAKLVEWYGVLNKKNLDLVQTPLKRLQYAIFERKNAEDAIVDAIVAWEGMFSGRYETTFQVTGSMAKFLRSSEGRDEFLGRLKKLYGLRSDLVHGAESKLLKKEDIRDVRAEVIQIGLECLMKIIRDDRLLAKSSSERVQAILIFDDFGDLTQKLSLRRGKNKIRKQNSLHRSYKHGLRKVIR